MIIFMDNANFIYDVFVSYSRTDESWVWDWLIPRLKAAEISVCSDQESFDVGVPNLVNMENAVAASRHTILVLTPAWVANQLANFEGLLGQHNDPMGQLQRTLPVLYQPCSVPPRIAQFTPADFTGEKDSEKEFKKLLNALQGFRLIPDADYIPIGYNKQPEKRDLSEIEQSLEYVNIDLRFYKYNKIKGTFNVIMQSETCTTSYGLEDVVQCHYDPKRFWNNSIVGTNLLAQITEGGIKEKDLYTIGQLLTDLALPAGRLRELFRESLEALKAHQKLRLRLRIDPFDLVELPWEYTLLPHRTSGKIAEDFLALQREVSIVRVETIDRPIQNFAPLSTVRIVSLISNPNDQLQFDANKAKMALDRAVGEMRKHSIKQSPDKIDWICRPATREILEEALQDRADIFHFVGHIRLDLDSDKGQILLEKADGTSDFYLLEDLARLLSEAKVRLAVLNIYEIGLPKGREGFWRGVASDLIHEQILAVVTNKFKTEDDYIHLFSSNLYSYLLTGSTIDEAMYQVRKALWNVAGAIGQQCWGIPILHLNPLSHAILFPRAAIGDTFRNNAESYYGEILVKYAGIIEECQPFIAGANPLWADQHDETLKNLSSFSKSIDDFRGYLDKIDKGTLDVIGITPLLRYELITSLESLKQQGEDLGLHLSEFPHNGRTLATAMKRQRVRNDLEELERRMSEIRLIYSSLML